MAIAPNPQLDAWYHEARQHNVAHAQVSTRAERRAFWATVAASVLAIFAGTAWTGDLAGAGIVSSTAVQWVASVAAFLAALLSAIVAAADFKQDSIDHTSAKLRWATVDSDIEHMRIDGMYHMPVDSHQLKRLEADRAKALEGDLNLTPDELARAQEWLLLNG